MKIIVANENEKKLMRRFISAIHDLDALDLMCNYDEETSDGGGSMLNFDEYRLINENLTAGRVFVDREEREMFFDESSVIVGECHLCHQMTEGYCDDREVTYSEYLDHRNNYDPNNWICTDCATKSSNREESIGETNAHEIK